MLAFFLAALESEEDRCWFTDLYHRYHKAMEQIAISILKNQSDAEDAVQNAFLQVIRHFDKLSEIPYSKVNFWLISIVRNEALMLLRKRRPTAPLEDWDGAVPEGPLDYADIVELFAQLPDTYRIALEMRLLLDCPNKEIAKRLGISEAAVKTRISRGRELLRRLVEEEL